MYPTNELPTLLDEVEAAEILTLKVTTLRRWRWSGDGPEFIKLGSAVRYDRETLAEWLDERRRRSTSDTPGPKASQSENSGPSK